MQFVRTLPCFLRVSSEDMLRLSRRRRTGCSIHSAAGGRPFLNPSCLAETRRAQTLTQLLSAFHAPRPITPVLMPLRRILIFWKIGLKKGAKMDGRQNAHLCRHFSGVRSIHQHLGNCFSFGQFSIGVAIERNDSLQLLCSDRFMGKWTDRRPISATRCRARFV